MLHRKNASCHANVMRYFNRKTSENKSIKKSTNRNLKSGVL